MRYQQQNIIPSGVNWIKNNLWFESFFPDKGLREAQMWVPDSVREFLESSNNTAIEGMPSCVWCSYNVNLPICHEALYVIWLVI